MKILWVKAGGLLPPDTGGKIRSYQILKELARRNDVTLCLFYAAEQKDRHGELESQFARVIRWQVKLSDRGSWIERAKYAGNLLTLRPYSVARFFRSEVLDGLRRLLEQEEFDIIVCDFVLAAPVIPWTSHIPKVIFTHNVEARIWKRHFEVARNPIWKAVWWREYWTTVRMERDYSEAADHVLTVSEADRQYFCQFADSSRVTAIPTGVDLDYFQPRPRREQPHHLVFTGSMDYLPNEDAVLYFAKQILPGIRKAVPGVVFWVVGRNPSARVRELAARDAAVRVTGSVEDIRPYIAQGSVYVVPIRVGSGTRLKIFEAMAMAKAIVSTTVGAEGLPVRNGEDIVLEDDPEGFAQSVIRLLRDDFARRQLGEAARRLVSRRYSWAHVAAECESVFAKVIQGHAEVETLEGVNGTSASKLPALESTGPPESVRR